MESNSFSRKLKSVLLLPSFCFGNFLYLMKYKSFRFSVNLERLSFVKIRGVNARILKILPVKLLVLKPAKENSVSNTILKQIIKSVRVRWYNRGIIEVNLIQPFSQWSIWEMINRCNVGDIPLKEEATLIVINPDSYLYILLQGKLVGVKLVVVLTEDFVHYDKLNIFHDMIDLVLCPKSCLSNLNTSLCEILPYSNSAELNIRLSDFKRIWAQSRGPLVPLSIDNEKCDYQSIIKEKKLDGDIYFFSNSKEILKDASKAKSSKEMVEFLCESADSIYIRNKDLMIYSMAYEKNQISLMINRLIMKGRKFEVVYV